MGDAPFFPPPDASTGARPSGPYRSSDPLHAKVARPSTSSEHDAPPRAPLRPDGAEARARHVLVIDALVAARARKRSIAMLALALGVALFAGGAIVTIASNGHFVWFGGAIAGALMAVRAGLVLAGVQTRDE